MSEFLRPTHRQIVTYYVPSDRYSNRTNAAWPVIVKAIRAGVVLTIEWISQQYAENTVLFFDVVWGGNKHAPTGHLDAARIKGNERRARRLKARVIDLAPLIIGLRERGMSLAKTAGELTRLRVRTTSGKTIWTESTIRRLLIRSADQFPNRKKWNPSRQQYE
jgi:hypothetical protein